MVAGQAAATEHIQSPVDDYGSWQSEIWQGCIQNGSGHIQDNCCSFIKKCDSELQKRTMSNII
ncbi:MAG: hypothetical protein BA862_04980 [Desulfobulbaceae bacterium S3730MH12]|nr:MAG: hypothetical protein BA862_04980 [Desulfobulbaceae bacterium S3730MH12]OEU78758.1 MAG: hypothetical protein BA873_06090 [Desulfobulbaceae bacterium C00003063]